MAQFSDDLGSMTGRVRNFRPEVSSAQVYAWINDRIRQALDARTYWADLIKPGVLSLPDAYTTGTVSVSPASRTVTGTLTAWPVNDVVNTTITDSIDDIGYNEVVPASMAGITEDSILYVDASGTPEAVPVIEVKTTSFIGKFTTTHSAGATVTQSSLAGRQFRIADTDPIFTVRNVISAVSLELTELWGGAAKVDQAYRILKMYVTLAPDLKAILAMKDETWGRPIRLHVSVSEVNWRDPRRSSTSNTGILHLVDLGPNDNGNMQYEIWPAPTSARQWSYLYYRQWPELVSETDRPPWFINPTIFVHGAIADALRFKTGAKDQYQNLQLANDYEQKFMIGLEQAKNADQAKWMRDYEFDYSKTFGRGGSDFWQSHDPDVMDWSLGGIY